MRPVLSTLAQLLGSPRPRVVVVGLALADWTISLPAHAQGRSGRGERGGYGAAGNSGRAAAGAADEAPKGPVTFPERSADASAGPLAEYQKPTYEQYRFAVSPDGTRLALSGQHRTKEQAGAKRPPDKTKIAAGGKSRPPQSSPVWLVVSTTATAMSP